MSNLTGKQIKQLHDALLDGYNVDSLRRLVRLHLDESLANIAGGATFTDLVFNLLEWAERTGRVVELMQAAHAENPNNVALQTAWADLQRWLAPPAPTPLPSPPAHLFLSYSRADHAVMEQVRTTLHAAGIISWTDHGLTPGTPNWQQAIEQAIRQTQGMVVLLSPVAKASEWVNIEVNMALDLGRRVFPLLIQGDKTDAVPIRLYNTQFVDARTDLIGSLTTKLLPTLHQHLGMTQPLPATPTSPPAPSPLATTPTLLASLRTVLAALYPDEASARRLVDDAGLDAGCIIFSGQANNTWHAIVQEADKVGKLGDLLAIVQSEYGTNLALREVLVAFNGPGETKPISTKSQETGHLVEPMARQPYEQPPPSFEQLKFEADTVQRVLATTRDTKKIIASPILASGSVLDFDWITIPAEPFGMGSRKESKWGLLSRLFGTAPASVTNATLLSLPDDPQAYDDEIPQHQITLWTYRIARTPVTNAQYRVFLQAAKRPTPQHWINGQIPTGKEEHPVVYVDWQDAQAFCQWVAAEIGITIRLPSEAEWEKAARGVDGRIWPWGNTAPTDDYGNFNRRVDDTSPVGCYPAGASPYGCLDMAGNVWEWTSSLYKDYPYRGDDGREDPKVSGVHTLRGGSFADPVRLARCACRYWYHFGLRNLNVGFRVVSPSS